MLGDIFCAPCIPMLISVPKIWLQFRLGCCHYCEEFPDSVFVKHVLHHLLIGQYRAGQPVSIWAGEEKAGFLSPESQGEGFSWTLRSSHWDTDEGG